MKRGTLPLTALRAFEATMRHGQMRLAADELGVTHGAISRQVRGLEDMLGVVLFEGPRNRLAPSEAALALQPALTEAFDGIETAIERIVARERRVIDVSCTSTLAMRWLIPQLVHFQAEHPEIEIRLTADHGPVDFSRHSFDVAIRVGAGPWPDGAVLELFPDRVGPVLSPKLLPLVEAGTVLDVPLLHTSTRPDAWPDWCRQTGLPDPDGGRVFEHFYFMLEAATAGLGAAIAPDVLIRDDLAAGRLVAPFGFHPSGLSYVALSPPRACRDAETFVAWLAVRAELLPQA
ncbi:LysR substrate-binding domain-containing protein [Amorphus orientalis]|uniref:DNA-binding transcriptional LysR family regulator n=1 Tax=Amorphus orientalis TaxID=649198 RepID=A0AAE4AVR2_9HYPH|nr:LysR substrate-binding domain-containing protein [Amorphus orientalis]MDQ0316934.1 DNA-binding transcriptional LysR family regulator [Amorphus orientalis]